MLRRELSPKPLHLTHNLFGHCENQTWAPGHGLCTINKAHIPGRVGPCQSRSTCCHQTKLGQARALGLQSSLSTYAKSKALPLVHWFSPAMNPAVERKYRFLKLFLFMWNGQQIPEYFGVARNWLISDFNFHWPWFFSHLQKFSILPLDDFEIR